MKRTLDISLSAVGVIVLLPIMVILALVVLIDSGRPVLFSQERIGRGGRPIVILKFRSMSPSKADDALVTAADDVRITRVGAWMRSTKLDEIPQLFNVLRGDLSLVGPRPEVAKYVALWPETDRDVILSVRPGITDPASTKYRREAELLAAQSNPEAYYRDVVLPDKVEIYRKYAQHSSTKTDVGLLLETLKAVVLR